MRSWVPVPGTTTGRLVEAALELFGAQGFGPVAVTSIAERAGVTTGSLYHHFGSKAGLYRLVRADVERRVTDRLEGAAATRSVRRIADVAPILIIGFDYLVTSGYARLLAEPSPEVAEEPAPPDEIEAWAAGLSVPAYVIDDHTAIKVVDGIVEVVSEGRWELLNQSRDAS